MLTLGGLIAFFLVAIGVGKRCQRMTFGIYLLLLFLAILQTGVVLYDMFTLEMPKP